MRPRFQIPEIAEAEKTPIVSELLGMVEQRSGKLRNAFASFKKAVELDPDQALLRTQLAVGKIVAGDAREWTRAAEGSIEADAAGVAALTAEYRAEVRELVRRGLVVQSDGVFFAAEQLYGVRFEERHDLPVFQPEALDILDLAVLGKADGDHLAIRLDRRAPQEPLVIGPDIIPAAIIDDARSARPPQDALDRFLGVDADLLAEHGFIRT